MSYLTVHLISDLFLGFNEFAGEDENIPDVDLVVLNGNIGILKRSMFYAETLCNKYPEIQFVCNLGEMELYNNMPVKSIDEVRDKMFKRQLTNASWPKNLHCNFNDSSIIHCRNGKKIDIFTAYGFPNVITCTGNWQDTNWYKYYVKNVEFDSSKNIFKPYESSDVRHGAIAIPANLQFINDSHLQEYEKVKKWEITNNNCYKILVTHINPINDSRLSTQKYRPYNIHLDSTGTWLSSNCEQNGIRFIGGRLFSNPGRGTHKRNQIINIE